MPTGNLSHWGSEQFGLILGLVVFGASVLPPVLWLVNDPSLLAGYPTLYVWALLWGIAGTGLLYFMTASGHFGIDSNQVPPELRDVTTSLPSEQGNEPPLSATGGED